MRSKDVYQNFQNHFCFHLNQADQRNFKKLDVNYTNDKLI